MALRCWILPEISFSSITLVIRTFPVRLDYGVVSGIVVERAGVEPLNNRVGKREGGVDSKRTTSSSNDDVGILVGRLSAGLGKVS
ncbi:hypothetical protein N7517_005228 [Penicillium concentricum]|uniref:Uncharacterized protein n=1 Tax=Penicillium concentricum TaxID=293559 RepID=A0A9W9S700_9EURO|nr:uncharacterized protein N7517_005228 [Penicillium concentricum]KAJ5373222.1 hypothetical protein N7517_005228 [Penicillium concentricum]